MSNGTDENKEKNEIPGGEPESSGAPRTEEPRTETTEVKEDSTDKLLYTLSYPIGIIGLVLILTKKENRNARYHGFNSLFLWLAVMVVTTVLGIVIGILSNIPGLGWIIGILGGLVLSVIPLAVLIYSIVLALQVNKGEYPKIPFVTDFAMQYIDPAGPAK